MASLKVLLLVSFLGLISLSVAQIDENTFTTENMTENDDISVARKKKDGMKDMYMMAMMVRSAFQTMMDMVSKVIEMKSFGLSMIDTILNLVQTVSMMKSSTHPSSSSWEGDRRHDMLSPHTHPTVLHGYSAH